MKKILGVLGTGFIGLTFLCNSVIATSGTVTGTSVRIREEASSSSEVISVATQGEKVNVISEEDGWYKVEFENVTGYISKDYVNTDFSETSNSNNETNTNFSPNDTNTTSENNDNNEQPSNDKPEENNSSENNNSQSQNQMPQTTSGNIGTKVSIITDAGVRRLPVFSSNVTSNISKGTEVIIQDELNNWIKVTDNTTTGWILKVNAFESTNSSLTGNDNNSIQTSSPETQEPSTTPNVITEDDFIEAEAGKTGRINSDNARLREEPDGEVIDIANINSKVEILGEEGDWYKINIGDNKGCYIAKRLITLD